MSDAEKAAVRALLRGRMAALDPASRTEASARIASRVRTLPAWRASRCVLLFMPLRDEPDLSELLTEALSSGRCVALPAFSPGSGTYGARQIRDPHRDLVAGRFGIREPSLDCPSVSPAALDLALVPGLGFTRNGLRLGRGGGFYDRLLRDTPAVRCGVCRDEQVLDRLPAAPHDVTLQVVVTPSATHWAADQPEIPHGS